MGFATSVPLPRPARRDNEPLQKDLRAWGFEAPTGIDLPGEASGFLPDAEWGNDPDQRYLFGTGGWNPGGYILTMIGAGYMSVTPLQLASAYASDRERRPPVPPARGRSQS